VNNSQQSIDSNYCLLIPHYNHHEQLERFLPAIQSAGLPVLVVDDGSDTASLTALLTMAAANDWLEVEQLGKNQGKGVAVMHGIRIAAERGYTHVIQIDADGQHNAADIAAMITISSNAPDQMVSGWPVFGDDIPLARLKGRKLSLYLVRLETLSGKIEDAMCGFRVYPCDAMLALHRRWPVGARMQFDLEVLVRWMWAGRDISFMKTKVQYPEQGLSHFRMVSDNIQIGWMHTRLVIGMLLLSPLLLGRKLLKK